MRAGFPLIQKALLSVESDCALKTPVNNEGATCPEEAPDARSPPEHSIREHFVDKTGS